MSDSTNDNRPQQEATPSQEWGVFICYRQVDGTDVAQWLHGVLNELPLPLMPEGHGPAPKLHVYFDQTAPAVGDWTRVHEPALKRARAFLLVCSPGAHTRLGPDDWVHSELEWWLANRETAPIIVDPTGEGERWTPDKVKARWPNAQRLLIDLKEWAQLPKDERGRREANIRDRIVGGIRESERRTTYEDLERERARTRLLRRQRTYLSVSLAAAAAVTIVAVSLAFYARRQAQTSDSRALAAIAVQALQVDPLQSLRLSLAAVKRRRTLESERALSIALSVPRLRLVLVFDADSGFSRTVGSVAFSSNGKRLLAASADGTARVWDVKTGEELLKFVHGRPVYFAAFSPDGRQIVTTGNGGLVRLWDANTGRELRPLTGHEGNVTYAAFSPSGRYLVTADRSGKPGLWDLDTGARVAVLGPDQEGETAHFSADGELVATHGAGTRLWDGRSGRSLARLGGPDEVLSARFSADGHYLVSGYSNGRVRIWDTRTRTQVKELLGHTGAVFDARFNSAGSRVVTASADGTTRMWSPTTGAELQALRGEGGSVTNAILAPDETRIATLGLFDGSARVWDAGTGEQLHVFAGAAGGRGKVSSADFSPDGALLATGLEAGTILVWDIGESRGAPFLLRAIEGAAGSAWFSKDDKHILTAHAHDGVALLDRVTGERLGSFQPDDGRLHGAWFSPSSNGILTSSRSNRHQLRIWAVDEAGGFSAPRAMQALALRSRSSPYEPIGLPDLGWVAVTPDGKRVAAVDTRSAATVWEAVGDDGLRVVLEVPVIASAVALSPTGQTLVIAGWSDSAEIWDVDSRQKLRTLKGHSSAMVSASFSPGGQKIVTASWDKTARIWDLSSGGTTVVLRGHGAEVNHAEFSPDGRRVATASADGTARIWDAESGLELHRLDGKGPVITASYSHNGRWIVTAGSSVRVFTVDLDDLMRIAGERLPFEDPRLPPDGRLPTSLR